MSVSAFPCFSACLSPPLVVPSTQLTPFTSLPGTDVETFWLDHFRQECAEAEVVLVGNKVDACKHAEMTPAARRARRFADEHGLPLVLSSAKTGTGVSAVFETVAQLCQDAQSIAKAL